MCRSITLFTILTTAGKKKVQVQHSDHRKGLVALVEFDERGIVLSQAGMANDVPTSVSTR